MSRSRVETRRSRARPHGLRLLRRLPAQNGLQDLFWMVRPSRGRPAARAATSDPRRRSGRRSVGFCFRTSVPTLMRHCCPSMRTSLYKRPFLCPKWSAGHPRSLFPLQGTAGAGPVAVHPAGNIRSALFLMREPAKGRPVMPGADRTLVRWPGGRTGVGGRGRRSPAPPASVGPGGSGAGGSDTRPPHRPQPPLERTARDPDPEPPRTGALRPRTRPAATGGPPDARRGVDRPPRSFPDSCRDRVRHLRAGLRFDAQWSMHPSAPERQPRVIR